MSSERNAFAHRSEEYAQSRPRYPQGLYEWISSCCAGRDAAWDCATGTGQAAIALAGRFETVYATDVSVEQVRAAYRAPGIRYSVQPAERTNFEAKSFDLVTVAQALHWFDFSRFWQEVTRVCKPGALFCAWGYAELRCDPEVERLLVSPFRDLVRAYWAHNNEVLWNGYRSADIAFPFERLNAPPLAIDLEWTVGRLAAYMKTWSAYRRCVEEPRAAAAIGSLIHAAIRRFGEHEQIEISMPLCVVAGYVPA
jgi:SAM-dependent methyltransferase